MKKLAVLSLAVLLGACSSTQTTRQSAKADQSTLFHSIMPTMLAEEMCQSPGFAACFSMTQQQCNTVLTASAKSCEPEIRAKFSVIDSREIAGEAGSAYAQCAAGKMFVENHGDSMTKTMQCITKLKFVPSTEMAALIKASKEQ